MSDDLNTLLDELSSFQMPKKPQPVIVAETSEVTDENINDFILKKASKLINSGLGAVDELKDFIVQGQNPDEIAALSELISSTTKALEALNRINLQNKKAKTDKELKLIDVEGRKSIAGMLPGNNITNNTNVLIASREEVFKKLLEAEKEIEPEPIQIIDSEIIEETT
jgi:hypothetical protein